MRRVFPLLARALLQTRPVRGGGGGLTPLNTPLAVLPIPSSRVGLRCLTTPHGALPSITKAVQAEERRMLQVHWSWGEVSVYPWLWLRDNCQCKACFHAVSKCRTFYLHDLDLKIQPLQTKVTEDGVEVTWSDGHTSFQAADWLIERAFEPHQRVKRDRVHRLKRQAWPEKLPTVEYEEIMNTEQGLLRWLHLLETHGLVLVTSAPRETGVVRKMSERVAFIKPTHYGAEFSVEVKPSPSNVAYTNSFLALHLDLPYYKYKPGVQLIHCITQYEGEGAMSQVSDAVTVAEQLRTTQPDMFSLLSSVVVDWVDHAEEGGRPWFKAGRGPVICLEADGQTIERINFSQPQRDSFFAECPVEEVAAWYEALRTFHDLLYRQSTTFKMETGSVMTLDNLRVVHGRTEYNGANASRHLEGCYMDWDEVRSKRRVLQQQQEQL